MQEVSEHKIIATLKRGSVQLWILTVEPEKMKFVGIGGNPRNVGRKVNQCAYFNIVFIDARAFVDHGGEREKPGIS